MALVLRQRKRTSTPRSRAGCLTCRQRHIKCDEGRPSCGNCTRTKRECKQPAKPPDSCDLAKVLLITSYDLPFTVPGSAPDRRALHFYFSRNQSYTSLGCAAKFWCTLVPQRCQQESVLRHTLVAYSRALLYQSTVEAKGDLDTPDLLKDALETNGRAIKALRTYIDRARTPDPVVILTCCILLVSVSQLLDRLDEAALHLDHAVSLFNTWHGQRLKSVPSAEHRVMHTMLGVIDALAHMKQPSYAPRVILDTYRHSDMYENDLLPLSFGALEDCHCQGLMNSYLPIAHFLARNAGLWQGSHDEVPHSILEEQQTMMRHAKRWDVATQAYERTHYGNSEKSSDTSKIMEHMGLLTGQAYNLVGECLLAQSIPACAPSPPIFDQNSAQIFELARRYCLCKDRLRVLDKNDMGFDEWKPNSVHISQCLDMLAQQTARPDIRATAVELSQETATWEGLGR